MDETLSLPTEDSVTLALRTQQIIAEESGVINNIDPLGGSYFIEDLTDRMEKEAFEYISKIDNMGGIIKAIDSGYPQNEIAEASYLYQKQVDSNKKTIVGVNKYITHNNNDIDLHTFDDNVEMNQIKRLRDVKNSRNINKVKKSLRKLKDAEDKIDGCNLMPFIINSIREYVTLGEISDVFRDVYGTYKDPGYF